MITLFVRILFVFMRAQMSVLIIARIVIKIDVPHARALNRERAKGGNE